MDNQSNQQENNRKIDNKLLDKMGEPIKLFLDTVTDHNPNNQQRDPNRDNSQ
ncbi:hypothetical protein [Metabacillus fastidiosus]|uniref:hypothetical protein n=1 Tax=Metabacillus fastidiosus TaxID=1458 RepID=UPI000B1A1E7E|nr:hypothetical protein [Metabacillus fastidiosus]MED4462675.1 hypothetical protein [Metabacillus fastidiosus]